MRKIAATRLRAAKLIQLALQLHDWPGNLRFESDGSESIPPVVLAALRHGLCDNLFDRG